MNARTLVARLLLPALRLAEGFRAPPAGAVRMVILHHIAPASQESFLRLIDHLERRFGFVCPDEAAARLRGKGAGDGRAPVLLTFDDGFRSNLEATRRVLDPRGIKALFFVCPGLIDLPRPQQRAAIAARIFRGRVSESQLPGPMELMDWSMLGTLRDGGHHIGCHGLTHDRLAGLDAAALERQVGEARLRLEQCIGPTPWFAFPFGDLGSIDAAALAAIGRHFPLCRSGVRGLAHAGSAPLALPAESVQPEDDWAWMRLAAEGGLAFRYRRALAELERMAP